MGHLSFCQENAWVNITSASVCLEVCVCVYSRFFMIEKWFQALEKSCKDHFLGLIRGEGIFLQGLPV